MLFQKGELKKKKQKPIPRKYSIIISASPFVDLILHTFVFVSYI